MPCVWPRRFTLVSWNWTHSIGSRGGVSLHDTDSGELDRRMREATGGERWVVAGSYMSHSQQAFWDRLDAVIWLDLPMALLLRRVLRRTWWRWRSRELLWGTNQERFWPQFLVWKKARVAARLDRHPARPQAAGHAGVPVGSALVAHPLRAADLGP